MHIVITGGGTGGHVFPALEIAKAFIKYNENISITFVGNKNSLEERMAHKACLRFFGLGTKALVGKGLFGQLYALICLSIAIIQSLWFLLEDRPKAVIGVGGYVSAPMIIASYILGIPRFIAEQNVEPGFANKMLSKLANQVFISFAESAHYFRNPLLTGNPIREQFFELERKPMSLPFKILVTGGSMGAQFLNEEVPKALAIVKEACPEIRVTHQTGQDKRAYVKDYYGREHIEAQVTPFIENMPEAFQSHDLLISRAGATVIAEIMASGMPTVLVPYRHAGGHQRANALAMSEPNAAKIVEETNNFASVLANIIKELYQHPEELMLMSQRAQKMAKRNAADCIVKAVLEHCD